MKTYQKEIDGKLVVGIASIIEKEEEYEDIILRWGWCKEELKKGVSHGRFKQSIASSEGFCQ